MAREESMDMAPIGLNVLVVDDNPTCLMVVERLLRQLKYIVTISTEAILALQILRENKGKFDIVISDVHMPIMNGLDLLEHIGLELDIPVIMLSANDDSRLVMKGVKYGAVDYILKPVRLDQLRYIWQHVVRRRQLQKGKQADVSKAGAEEVERPLLMDGIDSTIPEEFQIKKRKENDSEGEGGEKNEEAGGPESADLASQKRARVHWCPDLHKKFVTAVDVLGPDRAFPKRILEVMNTEGLTREKVASHLQKYRLYLKRLKSDASDVPTPSTVQNSGPQLGTYGGTLSLARMDPTYRGLSQPATNIGTNLFQNQKAAGPPTLMELTRRLESWNQQIPLIHNQLLPNPGVNGAGVSNLQTTQASSSLNPPPANFGAPNAAGGQEILIAQNFGYNENLGAQASSSLYQPPANLWAPNAAIIGGQEILIAQNFGYNENLGAQASSSLNPPPANHGAPNAAIIGGQEILIAQNFGYNENIEPHRWQDPMVGSSNQTFGVESPAQFDSNLDLTFVDDLLKDFLVDEPDIPQEDQNEGGGDIEGTLRGLPK